MKNSIMTELFQGILKSRGINLKDEEINKFSDEFSGILMLRITEEAEKKFSSNEKELLGDYFQKEDYPKVVELVKGKYSDEEWKEVVKKHLVPLMNDYLENVIGVE